MEEKMMQVRNDHPRRSQKRRRKRFPWGDIVATLLVVAEEKAEIVRRCLRNEISIGTASQEVCVNKTTILRWIAQYETEGAAVFLPHRGGRIYSEEVKRQAVQEYLSGMGSLREISQKEAKAEADALRDSIKAEMMERDTEELTAGQYIVRWTSVISNRFDTTAFKKVMPDVYKAYTKAVSSRRFSISA